jgi:flagellar hook-associated protein 1 FlgK
VNIDDELQRLVEIEQAFAANSQVIRSLSEMLDTLLAAF